MRADDTSAPAQVARVVTDAPSAVLLVDLSQATVVYANPVAAQLAPDTRLPVEVAEWSHRAGLRDTTGEALETTPAPLQRVASGQPVHGEVVTASRGSDIADAREQLWVVGMPLTDAPGPLAQRALVVFLPLRESRAIADTRAALADLRHQAVVASDIAFTITDPNEPDDPLVWVNPAFEHSTGYRAEQVLGRNCRFLQGPLTDPATVARIRADLDATGTVSETLLNYRADGTAFWNHLVISSVYDENGRLSHRVGVQTDVTERIDADTARDAALARAEAATHRQRAVAAISAALSARAADLGDPATTLPGLIASHFPGWSSIVTLDRTGEMDDVAVAYGAVQGQSAAQLGGPTALEGTPVSPAVADRDPKLAERFVREYLLGPGRDILRAASARTATWPVVRQVSAIETEQLLDAPMAPGFADERGDHAVLVAPLMAQGRVDGLLVVSRAGVGALTDNEENAALADVAMRVGTALDNARLYAAEHETALTLQRSLLPSLPTLASFDVAAAYVPATAAAVGGDWFDVLDLPGPWVGVAIGDVMGHDMTAAAAMGQLRSMVRALAWEGHRPAELIGKLDHLVQDLASTPMATLLYAFLDDPADYGGRCTVTYTNAGHLPALLRHADGRVQPLDQALTSPLGVRGSAEPGQAKVDMPAGAAIVLYTDGLVERRDADLDDGLDALKDAVAGTVGTTDATAIRDAITAALVRPDLADDTCVLVITRRDRSG